MGGVKEPMATEHGTSDNMRQQFGKTDHEYNIPEVPSSAPFVSRAPKL